MVNPKRSRIPTTRQLILLDIAIKMFADGFYNIRPVRLHRYLNEHSAENNGFSIPLTTLFKWFADARFLAWFDKAISERIKTEMNIEARNLAFVNKLWQEAMKDEPNMKAAELYARISGLYQDTNINIDARQQTVNVKINIPSIEDLQKQGAPVIMERSASKMLPDKHQQ